MVRGWFGDMCPICFGGLTTDQCFMDADGVRWDVHIGSCAVEAGHMIWWPLTDWQRDG